MVNVKGRVVNESGYKVDWIPNATDSIIRKTAAAHSIICLHS